MSGTGETYADLFLSNYMCTAPSCLAIYEFIVTLPEEVNLGWAKKFNATSGLLISVRWVMLLDALFTLNPSTEQNCVPVGILLAITSMLSTVQVSVFSALRVYAVGERKIIPAVIVGAIGLIPVPINAYVTGVSTFQYFGAPLYSCNEISPSTANWDEISTAFVYTCRITAIIADVILITVTWMNTFRSWREGRQLGMSMSIFSCVLRDGTIYFVALFFINMMQIVTDKANVTYTFNFLAIMPAILINRFILNLRSLDTAGNMSTTKSLQAEASLGFRQPIGFLGNIGESLAQVDESEAEDIDGLNLETTATMSTTGENRP